MAAPALRSCSQAGLVYHLNDALAFWEPGLFANQNTAAKLRHTHTIQRLEEHFQLNGSDE